ncbi:MAG TPA: cysteine--tRNA ligase [Xanthobacteraceae bacterium]|nr:cysteine--tRNA ligase [Xanthobacteraceae bacterium]
MELRLFNTLTKEKEVFAPLDPARGVRMYVCGPTVYDFAHIGNARPVIVFDVLYRLLRHRYGEDKVKYVRNITDVDDKINARAAQEYPDLPLNEAIRLVTEKTERQFHEDVDALGCLRPDVEPRATEHIKEMRDLIDRLVKAGFAYVEQDHVLFEVGRMPDYGRLARRSLDEMEAGARVEVAPYKRNPMDFVLWKPSKPNEPGWPSPSGIQTPGRPGWHIECSAMSWKHLGETFDIHGGGIDLVFPHHENEIAQSRCAFHAPIMAKTWMHNGFLQVEGEKMSKSLGNFITIRELLKKWPGDVVRFQMLMTHYRQPIDWTENQTDLARRELGDWAHVLQGYYDWPPVDLPSELLSALADDLNTPKAISVLRDLYSQANKRGTDEIRVFASACKFIGFRNLGMPGYFDVGVTRIGVEDNSGPSLFDEEMTELRAALANNFPNDVVGRLQKAMTTDAHTVEIAKNGHITLVGNRLAFENDVANLMNQRHSARARKDWKESDRIRDELKAMGVVLKDNKDGTTTWEVAR